MQPWGQVSIPLLGHEEILLILVMQNFNLEDFNLFAIPYKHQLFCILSL